MHFIFLFRGASREQTLSNRYAALNRQNPATAYTCIAITCMLHCIIHKLAVTKEADPTPFNFSSVVSKK